VYDGYVRQRGTLTVMEAVRKMSYMPAVRLEKSTPQARKKGRLQVGADADVVVFDAKTFKDQSTFEKPNVPSVGVRYLLVNGTAVVDGGSLVSGVAPGKAITSRPAK
jgi:N-acyl-D-aspartate/D-glutamate deacylase